MTEGEFNLAMGVMQRTWYWCRIPPEAAETWWKLGLFADVAAEDVEAAITALAATEEMPPSPAKIRGWIAQHQDAASEALWSEVWRELMEERDRPGPWKGARWSQAVAPFVEHIGAARLESLSRGSDVPQEVMFGQLRHQWEAWRAREADRHATESLPGVSAFRSRRGLPCLPGQPGLVGEIVHLAERKGLGRKRRDALPPAVVE